MYQIGECTTYFQSNFTEIVVSKTSEGQRPFNFSSKYHSSSIPKHCFSITTRTSRYSIEISFFTNICQPVERSTHYFTSAPQPHGDGTSERWLWFIGQLRTLTFYLEVSHLRFQYPLLLTAIWPQQTEGTNTHQSPLRAWARKKKSRTEQESSHKLPKLEISISPLSNLRLLQLSKLNQPL